MKAATQEQAVKQPKKEWKDPPLIIDPDIIGKTQMSPETLRKKLGRTGMDVWTSLIWCRDKNGFTHVRNRKLTVNVNQRRAREGRHPIKDRSVRKATAKLTRLGLLEHVGKSGKTVVTRRVRGDYRREQVFIPTFVAEKLLCEPGAGGRRTGAGRPKKELCTGGESSVLETLTTGRKHSQLGKTLTTGAQKSGAGTMKKPGQDHSPKKSKGASYVIKRGIINKQPVEEIEVNSTTCEPKFSPYKEDKEVFDLSSNEERKRAVPAPIFSFSKRGSKTCAKVQSMIKNTRWEILTEEELNPPDPFEQGVLQPPTIPPPQQIPDSMEDDDMAWALIKLVRGCIEKKYGGRCLLFSNLTHVRNSTHYERIVEAGHTLRDLQITPAAWIASSIEQFRCTKHGRSENIPPMHLVFRASLIVRNAHIFRHADGGERTYNKPTVPPFTNAENALIERWCKFNSERARKPVDPTRSIEDQLRELVEKHFPGGWVKYYEAVRAQEQNQQAEYIRRRNNWEYLWD